MERNAPIERRQALKLLAGAAGVAVLAACGSSGDDSGASGASSTTGSTSSGSTTASCTQVPQETAGPFPGDGTNGPNVLTESGVVRPDIRSSIGSASGTAEGVPLTVTMTVRDHANGCVPLVGAAVYIWHCDAAGLYSMYSDGAEDENYLRGLQETGADGTVTFTSIFPAAYDGRWPHIHFEVFPSVADATDGANAITTSQLAFPEDVCEDVYASDGYAQSAQNLSATSLEGDMVFSDGVDQQLATVTGSVDAGYVAELAFGV